MVSSKDSSRYIIHRQTTGDVSVFPIPRFLPTDRLSREFLDAQNPNTTIQLSSSPDLETFPKNGNLGIRMGQDLLRFRRVPAATAGASSLTDTLRGQSRLDVGAYFIDSEEPRVLRRMTEWNPVNNNPDRCVFFSFSGREMFYSVRENVRHGVNTILTGIFVTSAIATQTLGQFVSPTAPRQQVASLSPDRNNSMQALIRDAESLLPANAPALPPEDTVPPISQKVTEAIDLQRIYTVQGGDWLLKIANKYGTTVAAISLANKLNSNIIHPGQKLIIPFDQGTKQTISLESQARIPEKPTPQPETIAPVVAESLGDYDVANLQINVFAEKNIIPSATLNNVLTSIFSYHANNGTPEHNALMLALGRSMGFSQGFTGDQQISSCDPRNFSAQDRMNAVLWAISDYLGEHGIIMDLPAGTDHMIISTLSRDEMRHMGESAHLHIYGKTAGYKKQLDARKFENYINNIAHGENMFIMTYKYKNTLIPVLLFHTEKGYQALDTNARGSRLISLPEYIDFANQHNMYLQTVVGIQPYWQNNDHILSKKPNTSDQIEAEQDIAQHIVQNIATVAEQTWGALQNLLGSSSNSSSRTTASTENPKANMHISGRNNSQGTIKISPQDFSKLSLSSIVAHPSFGDFLDVYKDFMDAIIFKESGVGAGSAIPVLKGVEIAGLNPKDIGGKGESAKMSDYRKVLNAPKSTQRELVYAFYLKWYMPFQVKCDNLAINMNIFDSCFNRGPGGGITILKIAMNTVLEKVGLAHRCSIYANTMNGAKQNMNYKWTAQDQRMLNVLAEDHSEALVRAFYGARSRYQQEVYGWSDSRKGLESRWRLIERESMKHLTQAVPMEVFESMITGINPEKSKSRIPPELKLPDSRIVTDPVFVLKQYRENPRQTIPEAAGALTDVLEGLKAQPENAQFRFAAISLANYIDAYNKGCYYSFPPMKVGDGYANLRSYRSDCTVEVFNSVAQNLEAMLPGFRANQVHQKFGNQTTDGFEHIFEFLVQTGAAKMYTWEEFASKDGKPKIPFAPGAAFVSIQNDYHGGLLIMNEEGRLVMLDSSAVYAKNGSAIGEIPHSDRRMGKAAQRCVIVIENPDALRIAMTNPNVKVVYNLSKKTNTPPSEYTHAKYLKPFSVEKRRAFLIAHPEIEFKNPENYTGTKEQNNLLLALLAKQKDNKTLLTEWRSMNSEKTLLPALAQVAPRIKNSVTGAIQKVSHTGDFTMTQLLNIERSVRVRFIKHFESRYGTEPIPDYRGTAAENRDFVTLLNEKTLFRKAFEIFLAEQKGGREVASR